MHVAAFLALTVAAAPPDDVVGDGFCAALGRYVDEAPRGFAALRDPDDPRTQRPLSQGAFGGGPATRTTDEMDATVTLDDAWSCTLRPGARALMRKPAGVQERSVAELLGDEPYSHCKWVFQDADAARARYATLVAKVGRCLHGLQPSVEETDAEAHRYATRFSRQGAPDVLVRVFKTGRRDVTVAVDVFMPIRR
jgi:hypothetical protein